jgi:Family of unknown function (DUF5677)
MKQNTLKNKRPSIYDSPNLDRIQRLCRQLLHLVEPLPNLSSKEDLYGTFLLLFVQRLQNHLESILNLGDAKETWLIARSALEGAAWIKWMSEEPKKRAKEYNNFSLREEYNHALRLHDIGIPFENQFGIRRFFGKNGEQLESKLKPFADKKRHYIRERKKLTQSHHELLTGNRIRAFIEKYIGTHDTTVYYDRFSEFDHWSPRTTNGLVMADSSVKYSGNGEMFQLVALEGCFVSLSIGLKEVAKYFDLKINTKLKLLESKFSQWKKRSPLLSSL